MFTVSGEVQGLNLCKALLHRMGMGHTAIIHTTSPAMAERFGREMPASRIIVYLPGAQGCCGMTTGLSELNDAGMWNVRRQLDNRERDLPPSAEHQAHRTPPRLKQLL